MAKVQNMAGGSLTNTAVLCFILGWQGGTVHQVADALGVTRDDILTASYTRMGELARKAQAVCRKGWEDSRKLPYIGTAS